MCSVKMKRIPILFLYLMIGTLVGISVSCGDSDDEIRKEVSPKVKRLMISMDTIDQDPIGLPNNRATISFQYFNEFGELGPLEDRDTLFVSLIDLRTSFEVDYILPNAVNTQYFSYQDGEVSILMPTSCCIVDPIPPYSPIDDTYQDVNYRMNVRTTKYEVPEMSFGITIDCSK